MVFGWFWGGFGAVLGWFRNASGRKKEGREEDTLLRVGREAGGRRAYMAAKKPKRTARARLADTEGKKSPSPRTRTHATRPTRSQKEQPGAEPLSHGAHWTTRGSSTQQPEQAYRYWPGPILVRWGALTETEHTPKKPQVCARG